MMTTAAATAVAAQVCRKLVSRSTLNRCIASGNAAAASASLRRKIVHPLDGTTPFKCNNFSISSDGGKRGLRTGKSHIFVDKPERDSAVAALDGWSEVRSCAEAVVIYIHAQSTY